MARRSLILDAFGNPFDLNLPTGTGSQGLLARGGAQNALSGMGGPNDKSIGTGLSPTRIQNRWVLGNLYAESWAAAKYIDIPVDDMFSRPKRYTGDDESKIHEIEKLRKKIAAERRVASAMKAARLYGTAFLVLVFGDGSDIGEPLDIEKVTPDYPLNAMHVVDRFCISEEETEYVTDISDPHFGEPETYRVFPKDTMGEEEHWVVHRSRVVRFDGREALSMFGWSGPYDTEWGLSELQCALDEIMHDVAASQAVSHLVQEASVGVFRVSGLRDALLGEADEDDATPEKYAESINRNKSIYRSIFLDSTDDFSRTDVQFHGLPPLLNYYATRLAAMAGIPETRFLGRSPGGFSTGDHDMDNYALSVAARQARYQRESGDDLDLILARSLGMDEALESEWPSLVELRPGERIAEVQAAVDALSTSYQDGIINEEHYAERLSVYDDIFGTVPKPVILPQEQAPEQAPGRRPPEGPGKAREDAEEEDKEPEQGAGSKAPEKAPREPEEES